MYKYQKKLLKWRIFSLPFLMKFGPRPCTIVQGLWPNFGTTLKIRKNFNFDRNQLKLAKQHKNMYMYQKKIIKMENFLLAICDGIWPETLKGL